MAAYNPDIVQSAVIVDMFPVNFSNNTLLDDTCTALLLLDTDNLKSRQQASEILANQIKVSFYTRLVSHIPCRQ